MGVSIGSPLDAESFLGNPIKMDDFGVPPFLCIFLNLAGFHELNRHKPATRLRNFHTLPYRAGCFSNGGSVTSCHHGFQ